jgi:GGDEF domain-containing protein
MIENEEKRTINESTIIKDAGLMDRIESFLSHVTELVIEKDLIIPLTCSAGIAIASNGETDFNTLYRHADTALYFSKNNGKNRYYMYSEGMSLEDMPITH